MFQRILMAAALIAAAPHAVPQSVKIKIEAIVNAASFQPGLPDGGSLATIFCSGLDSSLTGQAGTVIAPASSPLPTQLAGVQVSINGAPAPILAVVIPQAGDPTNAQINFQVPIERNVSLTTNVGMAGTLSVVVQNASTPVATDTLTTLPTPSEDTRLFTGVLPGGFFSDANGYAIALHASDLSLVTLQNPAHQGETITAYANDFFPVWPPPPIGFPTPPEPLFELLPGAITGIGSPYFPYLQTYVKPIPQNPATFYALTPALKVTFQGLAPGMVGVEQISFVVPEHQQPGDWPLFFNVGSCPDGSGCCNGCGGSLSSAYVNLPVR